MKSKVNIVIRSIIQILVLIWTSSFELYLIARVVTTLLEWLITEIYTRKKYKDIISTNPSIFHYYYDIFYYTPNNQQSIVLLSGVHTHEDGY